MLVTRTPDHLPLFQSARGIGTLLIMNTHLVFSTWGVGESFLDRASARTGVWSLAVFFGLSGFLLSRGWAAWAWREGRKPSLLKYARHRIVRILPAYWITLVVVLATTAPGQSPASILSNATLTQVYTGNLLPGFVQTWSLCAEIAFYFVAPVLWFTLFRRSRRAAFLALVAIGVMSMVLLGLSVTSVGLSVQGATLWLPTNMAWFCMGMSLAIFEPDIRSGGTRLPGLLRMPTTWLVASVAILLVTVAPLTGAMDLSDRGPGNTVLLQALFLASVACFLVAMLIPGAEATVWGRVVGSRPLVWLGQISYGLFLWQMLMIVVARNLTGAEYFNGQYWAPAIVTLGLTIVVAQLSWWFVENPTHGWLVRRDRSVAAGVDSIDEARDARDTHVADKPGLL